MAVVTKILSTEKKKYRGSDKEYTLLTLLLDDGTEVTTTKDIKVGDKVYTWYQIMVAKV